MFRCLIPKKTSNPTKQPSKSTLKLFPRSKIEMGSDMCSSMGLLEMVWARRRIMGYSLILTMRNLYCLVRNNKFLKEKKLLRKMTRSEKTRMIWK